MVKPRRARVESTRAVYPDIDRFGRPRRRLPRGGVDRLARLGCTYREFDATSLAYLNDPQAARERARDRGDAEHQHEVS